MKVPKNLSDLILNFTKLNSNTDRILKAINISLTAFRDPERADAVSELGDLSNMNTLRWIKQIMENSEEGLNILKAKPRICKDSIKFTSLEKYEKNSLGYHYYLFMKSNNFIPEERPVSKFMPDLELAYISQRYKETHDFYHVLLGYNIQVVEEIAVKWFEALHLRLPSASIASVFGQFRLSFQDQALLLTKYIPHVKLNAEQASFMLNQNFENLLKKNIDIVRKDLNIIPLKEFQENYSRL